MKDSSLLPSSNTKNTLKMHDKVLLGVLVPTALILLCATIMVALFVHNCPSNMVYDHTLKVCREKCKSPFKWNANTLTCLPVCDELTQWNQAADRCEPICGTAQIWNQVTKSCEDTNICTPPPSINPNTGEILNQTHFPNKENTQCMQGTVDQLNTLCKTSPCTMQSENPPVNCQPGDGWDGYDANITKRCYKYIDCQKIACNEDYCTSPTVKDVLGFIGQEASTYDHSCQNPSEATVASLCEAYKTSSHDNYEWKNPNCLNITPRSNIQFTIDPKNTPSTQQIIGVVTHPLVNILDTPIVYSYTLCLADKPDIVVASGVCNSAPIPDPTSNYGCNASSSWTCAEIVLNISAYPSLDTGSYVLKIEGTPSWEPTMIPPLYSLENKNYQIFLLPSSQGEGVSSKLNPVISADLAKELARDQGWTQAVNKQLVEQDPVNFKQMALDERFAISIVDNSAQQAVLVGCISAYCRDVSTQVDKKMVILAWPPINVHQPDLPGTCVITDTSIVKYWLIRTSTNDEHPNPVELLSPSHQPDTSAEILSYVDIVPINITVQYILAAYIYDPDAPEPKSPDNYAGSTCKSEQVYISVNVGDYSPKFCHTISPLEPGSLPPWMWRDNDTGMCMWEVNNMAARDYHCMFEYGTDKVIGTYDPNHIFLANAHTPDCRQIEPSWPSIGASKWISTYCDPVASGENTVCTVGTTQNMTVTCNGNVIAGDETLSLSDFSGKLQDVVDFSLKNNVYDGQDGAPKLDLTPISGAAAQVELWKKSYNHCGPNESPAAWGMTNFPCDAGDSECKELETLSGCDRNWCQPWTWVGTDNEKVSTYSQTRICYPQKSLDGEKSQCCNGRGTYIFNKDTQIHRGSCIDCENNYGGEWCQKNPCNDVNCNGNGVCKIDLSGNPYCICDSGFYNIVTTPRPMNFDLDCHIPEGTKIPICTPPSVCSNGQSPGPDPEKAMCVTMDSLTCNRNQCPTPGNECNYQTGYNTCRHYENPFKNQFTCSSCKGNKQACESDSECCSWDCKWTKTSWTGQHEYLCNGD